MTLHRYLPRLRRSLLSGRKAPRPEPRSRRPRVEPLEDRVVPAGSWQNLNATGTAPPDGGAMMMLLSDGSVLVQDGINPTTSAAQNTYRLSPQANTGDYVNGVWSQAGTMQEDRLFFSTAMLPDGRVFAVGGEYPKFSNTAEIYDPVTDSWSYVDSVPTAGTQVDLFGTVTGASNTSPITITTSATTAALQPGDSVTITGVTGNTAANGTFAISNITATGFDLNGSDGTMSGAFVNDGKGQWVGPAKSQFGDDPIEVLPGGKVLAGYFNDNTTYIFDPSAAPGSQWSKTGSKQDGDKSDEEAWVKLPANKILTYDIYASGSSGTFKAQIYDPATGQWTAVSDPGTPAPGILEDNGNQGSELGPAFRTADGNVVYFGANGNTAIYNPATNKWTAGFNEPQKDLTVARQTDSFGNVFYSVTPGGPATYLVGTDDPGAVLPNGHILIALSPLGPMKSAADGGGYSFPQATYIYEYDPTATTAAAAWTDVTPPGLSNVNAFALNMVLLPSGQVLLSDENGNFQVYTEDPTTGPKDAWRPTITNIADTHTVDSKGNEIYMLTGTQLTGISEGSNYGDDNESATNYPVVQFKDASGNVYYGRTFDWSTTDVATDGVSENVKFTLPAGKSLSDVPWISVIANGIANGAPTLTPPGDQASDEGASQTFDLGSFSDANGGGPWTVDVDWNDGSAHTTFNMASPGTIPQKSHTYAEEGSYTVTVKVTNTVDGEWDTKTFKVTVNDPAVVAKGGKSISAVEGALSASQVVATFTDPAGAESTADYSATINWGDGSSSGADQIAYDSGTNTFSVYGSHKYAEESTADHSGFAAGYHISVTVHHEQAPDSNTVTSTARVTDPSVVAKGMDINAKEGISFFLPVASFTDPGGAEAVGDYSADIDWGDGTGIQVGAGVISFSGMLGSTTDAFTVTAMHTFAEEGTFSITVTIHHELSTAVVVMNTGTVRDNYGLLLLDPTADKSLMVSGQGAVTVNNTGAVVVDSSSPSAIFLAGQAVVTTWEADVGIGGGAVTNGRAVLNLLEPEFNHEAATPDPIALPLPPAPTTHFPAVRYSGSAPLTLPPGTYDGGIAITGKGPVTLAPGGVYYMNGGGFTVSGQGSVTGMGVLIVNAPKASRDVISITGQGSVSLTAPMGLAGALAAYNGITIMQDPLSANPISIVGQGSLTMTGTLYAPAALLKLDGNGNATVSAFSAGRLSLGGVVIAADAMVTGNGGLTINADPAPSFQLATGLAAGLTADASALLTSQSGLRAGRLLVDVEDSRGAPTPGEPARIDEAIRGLNAALRPFGVDLVEATGAERSAASIRLDIAATTDFGGTAAGVLGLTENGDAITIVSGWNWYMGADPSAIAPGQFDFETVVAHELGHALGLGEGSDPASVMYPYLASGVARRALSSGDLGLIDSVEGAGRLAAPADAGGGAGPHSGAAPANSGARSGPDTATGGADVAALAAAVLGEVSAVPGGAAKAALAVVPVAGNMDVAVPQAPVAPGGPAVVIWTAAVTLVDPVAPADAPAAPPIAGPSLDDGDGAAPRGPVQQGMDGVPAAPGEKPPAPGAPAEDGESSGVPLLQTRDACFAAGVRAPAVPPAPLVSEGGGAAEAVLVAAGLALGLCDPRRREDESGRGQPSLK